jgi:hypothetical protein
MKGAPSSIAEQLRRNTVALISLVIAVSSLSYNTWRNEKTEDNRKQRFAAFEILLKLGELQEVVFYSHYDKDKQQKGNPRTGWDYVLTVSDLSRILHPPLPDTADRLLAVWSESWATLGEEQASADAITAAIDSARDATLQLLRSLE